MKYLSFFIVGITAFAALPLVSQDLYVIKESSTEGLRSGYINVRGDTVLRPGWSEAYNFSPDGLAMVEGKYKAVSPIDCEAFMHYGNVFISGMSFSYGFIRPNGTYISPRRWGKAYSFQDGMAAVGRDAEMAMGFIDTTGKLVIREQWQEPGYFSDGLLPVPLEIAELPNRWYLLDESGKSSPRPVMPVVPKVSGGLVYFPEGKKTVVYDLKGNYKFSTPWEVREFRDGVALLYAPNRGFGYITTGGEVIVPPDYQEAHPFSEGLGVARDKNSRFHVFDSRGHAVLKDLPYSRVNPFFQGRAVVSIMKGGVIDYGIIDKTGKFIVTQKYCDIRDFSEGLAAVCAREGKASRKCGYVDLSGKFVIAPRYSTAYDFNSGRARVRVAGEMYDSYIDTKGTPVFSAKDFRYFTDFREGVMRVGYNNFRYGYVDIHGKPIGETLFKQAAEFFSFGYAPVGVDDTKWSYIDTKGNPLFPYHNMMPGKFDDDGIARATGFRINGERWDVVFINRKGSIIYKGKDPSKAAHAGEGKIVINTVSQPEEEYVYIDRKGLQAVPGKFEMAWPFIKGRALVRVGGTYRLIDQKGAFLASFPYEEVIQMDEDLLTFRQGGKVGFADATGKVTVNPKFSHAENFSEGAIGVCTGQGADMKCGYVNRKGEYLFEPRFSTMPDIFSNGLARYYDISKKCGYFDKKGNIVIQPQYMECEPFYRGLALVKTNVPRYGARLSYIDTAGRTVWQQKTWLLGYWEGKYSYDFAERKLDWNNADYRLLRRAVFEETNRVRSMHKIPPFRHSPALERAAQGHSEDMVRLGFFSHVSPVPGKKTVKERLALAGLRGLWGENISEISEGATYGDFARNLVWAWATSPGHRANILHKELKCMGVGVARKGNSIKSTQNFSGTCGQ